MLVKNIYKRSEQSLLVAQQDAIRFKNGLQALFPFQVFDLSEIQNFGPIFPNCLIKKNKNRSKIVYMGPGNRRKSKNPIMIRFGIRIDLPSPTSKKRNPFCLVKISIESSANNLFYTNLGFYIQNKTSYTVDFTLYTQFYFSFQIIGLYQTIFAHFVQRSRPEPARTFPGAGAKVRIFWGPRTRAVPRLWVPDPFQGCTQNPDSGSVFRFFNSRTLILFC